MQLAVPAALRMRLQLPVLDQLLNDLRCVAFVHEIHSFGLWNRIRPQQSLPALPTVMSGVNQTIMLALSMVVIASMIGGGGLGDVVLRGIQQLDVGLGFEGGIAVVILAVILDRLSQSLMLEGERTLEARSRRWRSLWRTP